MTNHSRSRIKQAALALLLVLSAIWFLAWVLAMRFVTRAPTDRHLAKSHSVAWSNHGLLHYVPQSDYEFYEMVSSVAPYVIVLLFMVLLLYKWVDRPRNK